MKYEKSCGIIIFTRENDEIEYVIIKSINGFYGFPKGHVETGETETQTALREVFEEVGLKPTLIEGFREVVEYYISSINVQKQVVYFLGEYKNQDIIFQNEELLSAELMKFNEANSCFTHENNKELLLKADLFIKNM